MPHAVSLISLLAAGLGLALILGFVATRLRIPPLVGYLLAGIVIGPATPGFVADLSLASELAEIGVMLMMFGVGLHFSLQDLLEVRRIAVPGAGVQMLVATALGGGVAIWWGWNLGGALVFGLALSVASTVVVLRALEARGLLNTVNGHIAVGWLVVQDLIVVLILVLLPSIVPLFAGGSTTPEPATGGMWTSLALALAKVAAFVALILIVGRRVFPRFLWVVARSGSRELFTLAVIFAAVGIAFLAARLFSVSFALGAFFGGTMLRGSALSHRAAEESLPLRDAFSVLFFVSVGMLVDPQVIVQAPFKLIAVVAVIMIGTPLAAFALVLLSRYPLNSALTVGASLAQIGEFSFILAGLGVTLGVMPAEGRSLILAGALISISLNPLLFAVIEPAQAWIRSKSSLARALERSDDPLAELPATVDVETLTGHVVLVGYGRVGRRIGESLGTNGIRYVVAEANREIVERLRAQNINAVSGAASDPAVLIQAHIARASMLVVATPSTLEMRKMADIARTLNPKIEILLRTHNDEESALLEQENVGKVFMGEHELAIAMTQHILSRWTSAQRPL
ncbi:MAG: cation:proton antiporter domain-containing protein [Gemmatimonadaceae bacterium]